MDQKRTDAFRKAIFKTVKRDHVVLDAGTGSGIMALFAAKAGAKKVYAVEIASDVATIAKKNFQANKFSNIVVLKKDLKKIQLSDVSEKIDVVIMEMLDVGMIAEQQCFSINNLHENKVINHTTKIIPYRMDSFVELVNYDFNFYGFYMPFPIQARNYGANKKITEVLTGMIRYDSVIFEQPVSEEVDVKINATILRDGSVNAVRLRSQIFLLPHSIKLLGTSDMNMPVVIPIRNISVKKDNCVEIYLKYKRGEGLDKVKIWVRKK